MNRLLHIFDPRNSDSDGHNSTATPTTPPAFPMLGPGLTLPQRMLRLHVQRCDAEDRLTTSTPDGAEGRDRGN